MPNSDVLVIPVLNRSFQEITYIVYRKDSADCFLVDPGMEPESVIKTLRQNNLKPIAILITHGHGDHIAGIPAITAVWTDCKVYIGELDAPKLTDSEQNLTAAFGFDFVTNRADVLLQDSCRLEIAGIECEVRHVPGHSCGHVIYYLPSETAPLAFVGDVIFRGSIGRSDFPDSNPHIQIPMIKKQVLTLPAAAVLYPGHGSQTTVENEQKSNPFLQ